MCFGGGDPPEIEEQAPPPKMADPEIQEKLKAWSDLQKRRKGRSGTQRTGAGGVMTPEGTQKTLLGQ